MRISMAWSNEGTSDEPATQSSENQALQATALCVNPGPFFSLTDGFPTYQVAPRYSHVFSVRARIGTPTCHT
jgi:hypothetical protein